MITFEHLHHLLDGTARHKLNNRECDQQNAEKRRHHQKDAFTDIGEKMCVHGVR